MDRKQICGYWSLWAVEIELRINLPGADNVIEVAVRGDNGTRTLAQRGSSGQVPIIRSWLCVQLQPTSIPIMLSIR